MKLLLFVFLAGCASSTAQPRLWLAGAPPAPPLSVYVDPGFSEYQDAVTASETLWDQRVDCEVLRPEPEKSLADVVVEWGQDPCPGDSEVRGAAETCTSTTPMRIMVRKMLPFQTMFRVVGHEFGHTLHLPDGGYDIMAPRLGAPKKSDPPEYYLISDETAAAVHDRYCH